MKAIVIGATSGIGRELARQLSLDGYEVGITGRRTELLHSLENELNTRVYARSMDLTRVSESVQVLESLLAEMGKVDLIVLNAGTGDVGPQFPLDKELETIAVNVTGFSAMANRAWHYFCHQGGGHLVGISSVAAERGGPVAPYHASKAYVSNYLEGLACRARAKGVNLVITDVRPGFVDTPMAQSDNLFWMAPVEKATRQILRAIKTKRRIVYVTRRWRLVACLMRWMPFAVYKRLVGLG